MTERAVASSGWKAVLRRLLASPWFKGAVAGAIVLLLVRYNRLDWSVLAALGETWPWLLAAFALMFPPFAIVTYRFQLVLRSQEIDANFAQSLRLTMIGSFFDLSMPSSNGGDVVKAGMIARGVGTGRRTRAVMAVAFDRVLGLVGLFLLAVVVGLAGWGLVRDVPGRGMLLMASAAASFGVLAAFRILGARSLRDNPRLNAILRGRRWGEHLRKLVSAFNGLRERPWLFFSSLALSMLNHVFWCASLICIARAVGSPVNVLEGFIVFPLAIFSNIFGVAGGFGVGTVGFDLMLSLFLGIKNGALIGLIFQSLSAASKLAGLPFYFASHGHFNSMEPRA